MNIDRTTELLRHAANRASRRPFFLAGSLEQFRDHHGMGEVELAGFLGCVPQMLPRVALCRRPNPEAPEFRSDLQRIADAFGLRPERLLQVIREADVLESLRQARDQRLEEPDSAAHQESAPGLLMAARDLEIAEIVEEEPEAPDHTDNAEEP